MNTHVQHFSTSDQIWLLILAIFQKFYWFVCFISDKSVPLNKCFKRCFKSFLSPFQCKRLLSQRATAITQVPSPEQTKWGGTSWQRWGTKIDWTFAYKKLIFRSCTATNTYLKTLYARLKKEACKAGSVSYLVSHATPNRLKKSICSCKCYQTRKQDFAKEG